MKCNELPIDVDAVAIAKGMLELLTDNEYRGIQFGLFPAHVMEALKRAFEQRFRGIGLVGDMSDKQLAVTAEFGVVEYSLSRLVSECVHLVTVEMMTQAV